MKKYLVVSYNQHTVLCGGRYDTQLYHDSLLMKKAGLYLRKEAAENHALYEAAQFSKRMGIIEVFTFEKAIDEK